MSTNETTTRSGRKVKKPERWEPQEECTDDFGADEYDSDDGSDVSSVVSYESDEEMSDEDDDGSDLEDFIVDDDCED
jgi:hypothetical protein